MTSEAELDYFFGKVFSKIGSAVGQGFKSLGKGLKAIAPTVLPILGKVAGGAFGGPVGAMLGSKLGSLAGKVVEKLEVEELAGEGNELEVAKRFVEFAGLSARNLADARPGRDEAGAAMRAMAKAADQLAGARRAAPPPPSVARGRASPLFGWLSRAASAVPAADFDGTDFEYGPPSSEQQTVRAAIAAGERNENTLTNLVFYQRHPELGGGPLSSSQPGFSSLSREWLTLRDATVRPLLQTPSAPGVGAPSPSYGVSPTPAPSTGATPRLLVPESELTALLPVFARYTYSNGEPRYPWLPPGLSSAFRAPPYQTNCCCFLEALLWGAWSRRHGSAFQWNSQRHGQAVIADASYRYSSVDVYVQSGIATALPAGAPPLSWCVAQGWRKSGSGHNFIIVARHRTTDRVLTLEANMAYGLNGVGCRSVGNLRDLPGGRPPARWWESGAPRWQDVAGYYDAGLKLAKLGVTGASWAGLPA